MAGYRPGRAMAAKVCGTVTLLAFVGIVRADRVEMLNGDRYTGRVLELNTNVVVIQNDVLGKISLPRGKVANINLGAEPGTNSIYLSGHTNDPAQPRVAAAPRQVPAGGSPDVRQI